MTQTILTFVAEIDPEKGGQLRTLLEQIRQDLHGNPYVPFAALNLLHFASFVILDEQDYKPYLIFENNFDGSLDDYLEQLLRHSGPGLHQIYSCCLGYENTSYDERRMVSYLKARVVRPNAYHIGNVGRSADRIRQEIVLRDRIEGFLDTVVKFGEINSAPGDLRKSIQQFVKDDQSLNWTAGAPPRQTLVERYAPRVKIGLVFFGALLLLPILLPVAIIWALMIRRREKTDSDNYRAVDPEHVRRLVEREDWSVQNHLASVTRVKPGRFRRVTLRLVLWVANLLARVSDKGELIGIPSIHFAHWSLIDDGRRLLFLSNYGGSWGSYLDDFIDKASKGLTGIWSNTAGFPRSRFLVFEGATNGPRFKSFARESQIITRVWYSAYPDLTVRNIDNNSAIREQLFTTLDEAELKTWLRRF